MRNSQTLQLEASEKRSELSAVTSNLNAAATAGADPAAEDLGKAETLTKEIRGLEVRYRAAVLDEDAEDAEARATGDVDAETAELIGLETRSQVSPLHRRGDRQAHGRRCGGGIQRGAQDGRARLPAPFARPAASRPGRPRASIPSRVRPGGSTGCFPRAPRCASASPWSRSRPASPTSPSRRAAPVPRSAGRRRRLRMPAGRSG